MEISFIYITTENNNEAKKIGMALIESKLVACVNIIDNMESLYMWEGKMQNSRESVLIAKTTQDKVDKVVEKVRTLHSYECPCIISLPISGGHSPFIDWIKEEVK